MYISQFYFLLFFVILSSMIALPSCRKSEDSSFDSESDDHGWILGMSRFIRPELGLYDQYTLILCNTKTTPSLAEKRYDVAEFIRTCSFVFETIDEEGKRQPWRFSKVPSNLVLAKAKGEFEKKAGEYEEKKREFEKTIIAQTGTLDGLTDDLRELRARRAALEEEIKKNAEERKKIEEAATTVKPEAPAPKLSLPPAPAGVQGPPGGTGQSGPSGIRFLPAQPVVPGATNRYVEPAPAPAPPPETPQQMIERIDAAMIAKVELQKKYESMINTNKTTLKDINQRKAELSIDSVLATYPVNKKDLATNFNSLFKAVDFENPAAKSISVLDLIEAIRLTYDLRLSCRMLENWPELERAFDWSECRSRAAVPTFDFASVRGTSSVIYHGLYNGGSLGSLRLEAKSDGKITQSISLKFIGQTDNSNRLLESKYICNTETMTCSSEAGSPTGVIVKINHSNGFSFVNIDGDEFKFERQAEFIAGVYEGKKVPAVGEAEQAAIQLAFFYDRNGAIAVESNNGKFTLNGFRRDIARSTNELARHTSIVTSTTPSGASASWTYELAVDLGQRINLKGPNFEYNLTYKGDIGPTLRSGSYEIVTAELVPKATFKLINTGMYPYTVDLYFVADKPVTFTRNQDLPKQLLEKNQRASIVLSRDTQSQTEFTLNGDLGKKTFYRWVATP